MKIKILESAKQDLREGFDFYESQERGIGNYFLETLFSDISSLRLFAGIHSLCASANVNKLKKLKNAHFEVDIFCSM
jgi:hypothetical protein